MLLLEPPGDTILGASPAAVRLVCDGSEQPVGRRLVDVFGGANSGGLELIANGRLSAYETRRRLRTTGEPVNVWVRSIAAGGPRCAVVILARPAQPARRPTRSTVGRVVAIGSVGADLTIGSLTSDLADIVGVDADRLRGISILQLVEPADAGRLMGLIADGARSAQTVRLRMGEADDVHYELLLVPHVNDHGYAFTIMDVRAAHSVGDPVVGDAAATRVRGLLGKLGSRELEVVSELLNGNRVPAIAAKLYLSPGTVRNHLSTAFRKLDVHSQQELIDLLRRRPPMSA